MYACSNTLISFFIVSLIWEIFCKALIHWFYFKMFIEVALLNLNLSFLIANAR